MAASSPAQLERSCRRFGAQQLHPDLGEAQQTTRPESVCAQRTRRFHRSRDQCSYKTSPRRLGANTSTQLLVLHCMLLHSEVAIAIHLAARAATPRAQADAECPEYLCHYPGCLVRWMQAPEGRQWVSTSAHNHTCLRTCDEPAKKRSTSTLARLRGVSSPAFTAAKSLCDSDWIQVSAFRDSWSEANVGRRTAGGVHLGSCRASLYVCAL